AQLNQVAVPRDRDGAKLRAMTDRVNSIDISRCPQDYQAAYVELSSSLGEFVDYSIETNTWEYTAASGLESFVRGLTGDPLGAVRDERERRGRLRARLREAVANYQRALARYKRTSSRPGPLAPWRAPAATGTSVQVRRAAPNHVSGRCSRVKWAAADT